VPKTDRIEVRTDETTGELIRRAAELSRASTSQFIIAAAVDRAEAVVARADVTLMPAVQFDAMIEAIDRANPMPNLARAAAAPRRFRG
jgi:uncharacterized protein (DUF1778 family)